MTSGNGEAHMAQEKMGPTGNARNSRTVFMGHSCECLVMKHPGELVLWSSRPLRSHLSAADVFLWQSRTITTAEVAVAAYTWHYVTS